MMQIGTIQDFLLVPLESSPFQEITVIFNVWIAREDVTGKDMTRLRFFFQTLNNANKGL